MKKVVRKLKLNEFQNEKLHSLEMLRLAGGACACASMCTDDSSTASMDKYITSANSN